MVFPESQISVKFQQRLKSLSLYPAIIVCIVGVLVIAGWQSDIEFFKRIIPGMVAMNPLTAVCFILTGTTVIIISIYERAFSASYLAKVFGLLIVITGLTCLLTSISGITWSPDQLLFTEKLNDTISNIHNRMAPNTAFNFAITGISIVLISYKKYRASQYLILTTAFISLLSIIGYIYGAKAFYGILTYIPMAINTSFCFLFIAAALMLALCDEGLAAPFTDNYVGSILARNLMLPVIIIPVLLGFLIICGEKSGFYAPQFGAALFTSANILIFIFLIVKIQESVNKADRERRKAEIKLLDMNTKLEESTETLKVLNQELESFSYSVSHDLKAPLRAISLYSNIFKEDYGDKLDKEGSRLINNIADNSERMRQLIDDLLEFSRIRRKEMQKAGCDMESLVKNVLQKEYLDVKRKEYEIKIGELFSCQGDYKMIEQVWINLISNALKYSEKKEKPVIEIGSYKEDSKNVYFVKDNGAGFNMKHSNKLFGVFQRLHSGSDFEGTGIGLAIVHKIITRHGGKVWAEAREGEGANFYFSLPAAPIGHS